MGFLARFYPQRVMLSEVEQGGPLAAVTVGEFAPRGGAGCRVVTGGVQIPLDELVNRPPRDGLAFNGGHSAPTRPSSSTKPRSQCDSRSHESRRSRKSVVLRRVMVWVSEPLSGAGVGVPGFRHFWGADRFVEPSRHRLSSEQLGLTRIAGSDPLGHIGVCEQLETLSDYSCLSLGETIEQADVDLPAMVLHFRVPAASVLTPKDATDT